MLLIHLRKSLAFILCVALFSCQSPDDLVSADEPLDTRLTQLLNQAADGQGLQAFMFPPADQLAIIPQDPKNPLSAEKVALGKLLFHETGLARNPQNTEGMLTYSCASCHHVDGGFQAGRRQGIGDGGVGFGQFGEGRTMHPLYLESELDIQPIRTPSALNGAYQPLMLWNGQFGAGSLNQGTENLWPDDTPIATNRLGYEGLETQAIAGLGVHRLVIDDHLRQDPDYQQLFAAAFPNLAENDRFTPEQAGLAIAAYERTLLATEAPFQRWLQGDQDAMSETEKTGAILFFGEAGCVSCHQGPALNEMAFYALGMGDLEGNGIYGTGPDEKTKRGRGGFTGAAEDMYAFKVPQLYNLKDSPFYGHGGTFNSIREVVAYKNAGIPQVGGMPASILAADFQPLGLTSEEVDALTIFIERSLYDPSLYRYVPQDLPSGQCFPNNDASSKIDLDCD
ncbi:MAG: cytochrome c peroxidase [Bacteroidota bacterium]